MKKENRKKTKKIAASGTGRDFWGYTCIVCGGLFCVLAIALFIMTNRMNFYAQKVEATILSRSDMELEGGKKKLMLMLSYKVGNETVTTNYEYDDPELPETTVNIDVYYDVKNPRQIIADGWSFHSVFVLILGAGVLLMGLCIKGFILNEWYLFENEPPKEASIYQKQVFQIRKKTIENALPFGAGLLSAIYGLVMIILDGGWGTYVFLILGIGGMIFFGREFFPAMLEWYKKYRLSKLVVKAEVTDIQIEKNSDKTE